MLPTLCLVQVEHCNIVGNFDELNMRNTNSAQNVTALT